jgi:hypothetical protein
MTVLFDVARQLIFWLLSVTLLWVAAGAEHPESCPHLLQCDIDDELAKKGLGIFDRFAFFSLLAFVSCALLLYWRTCGLINILSSSLLT